MPMVPPRHIDEVPKFVAVIVVVNYRAAVFEQTVVVFVKFKIARSVISLLGLEAVSSGFMKTDYGLALLGRYQRTVHDKWKAA